MTSARCWRRVTRWFFQVNPKNGHDAEVRFRSVAPIQRSAHMHVLHSTRIKSILAVVVILLATVGVGGALL